MPPQDFDLKKFKSRGRKGEDFELTLQHFKMPKLRLPWIILVVFVIWLLSGFYMVRPGEEGVVRRFGRYVYSTSPGLRYHLPYPFERVDKVSLTEIRRLEVGYRTTEQGTSRFVPREAHMLTGDENIVNVAIIVQYRVRDAVRYLFNVRGQVDTIRDATESALRQVIGSHKIDDVLTVGKQQIQQETRLELQRLLDAYRLGVVVTAVQLQDVHPPKQVIHAFKDVASAKEDKNKLINQAEGYRNDVLPKARGEASQIVQKAKGYKEARIKRAEGDVQKFLLVLAKYRRAKRVTRERLYLETMEEVLPRARKIVLTDKAQMGLLNVLSDQFKVLSVGGKSGGGR